MRKGYKKPLLIILVAVALLTGYFLLSRKKTDPEAPKPAAENSQSAQNKKEEPRKAGEDNQTEEEFKEEIVSEELPAKNVPEKFLLEIPFYSQAPFSKWDAFHEDMCEEASILNAAYYLLGKKPSLEKYEQELQDMQKAEKKEIGEWKSTTIAQIKKVADTYFEGKIKSKIIESPTIDEIQTEVATENPVIVPLSGRDIGNPNFTPPGPVYHMLVIKGYDEKNFITNDVGTRKGNSYVYKKEVLIKNMHDWNKTDIHKGGKKVLVLYK